jgi:NAD-dependent DNA ligase
MAQEIIEQIQNGNIAEMLVNIKPKQLEEVITLSADAYHNGETPLITDQQYDVLIEKLRLLKPNSKVLKNTGAPIRGKKVSLPYWMGSMDKVKTEDEVNKWIKDNKGPYVLSDKLDGASCLLVKIDGVINMYTRGDGLVGQSIDHLYKMVNMYTEMFEKSGDDAVIRGELIMSKENFEKWAQEKSDARTTVSGVVNSKPASIDPDLAADIDFVAYEVLKPELRASEQFDQLEKWGFKVAHHVAKKTINWETLDNFYKKRRAESEYNIDGIIVTDNAIHIRNKTGNPPYSFAYKGETPTANVVVTDVIWDPSKDGLLIPTIQYEPVRLSSGTLTYTAGFNAAYIYNNGIGPGAVIKLVRSGDVIPYILEIVESVEPSLPEDEEWVWDKNEVNIVLKNPDVHPVVIAKRMLRFVEYVGVENLSEGLITKLVAAGYDTIDKLVDLTVDDLMEIEGFQKTLAVKIYKNLVNALSGLKLLTLMAASNIFGRGFGERKIKKILDVYPNIVDEYKPAQVANWRQKLNAIDGFDNISTNAFLDKLPEFQKFYKSISKKLVIEPHVNLVKRGGKFQGQNIVFTGFRNEAWKEFIELEGGKVSTSGPTKNTTLLVFASEDSSSAKFVKAQKLGVKMISKADFAALIAI